MKVVIVADIDIADDVNTCVLGYSSKKGWEEVEVTPRPLPQWKDECYHYGELAKNRFAVGYNACLDEIIGEIE